MWLVGRTGAAVTVPPAMVGLFCPGGLCHQGRGPRRSPKHFHLQHHAGDGLRTWSGLKTFHSCMVRGSSHCFQPRWFCDKFQFPMGGVRYGWAESPGKEHGLSRVPAGISFLTLSEASPLASLGLSFSICEMDIIKSTSEGKRRNQ